MAIAHVQDLATASGSASSLQSAAFGSPTTSGNTIIVVVWYQHSSGQTVSSVTDTASNTYTKDKSVVNTNLGCDIWRASSITGGSTFKITVNLSASASVAFTAAEFSGVSNTVDTSASSTGQSQTPQTGAFSTLNANDLIIIGMSEGGYSSAVSPVAGFTRINDYTGNISLAGDANYEIVSATQSGINPTWSFPQQVNWAACAVAYDATVTTDDGLVSNRIQMSIPPPMPRTQGADLWQPPYPTTLMPVANADGPDDIERRIIIFQP